MPDRFGTFYSPWPVIDGKSLNLQWGEIRSNQAETKAIVRSSFQELGAGDELNALRALLGQAYGDLTFSNKYRLLYDKVTKEFCLQKNDGTVATPIWTDVWCVRHADGQFQVVSQGGIFSAAGFYNFPKQIEQVADSHSLGTVTSDDVDIRCPSRIFFDSDSGLKVRKIECGSFQGSPEITLDQPFGKSQVFNASGPEWVIQHNFGAGPQIVQVMDTDDRVIIPDKADVSDPNIAYFYFHATTVGSVIIATGGLGAATLLPRDPFYLVVRTNDKPAAGATLDPNAELIFDTNFFYVNAHEDVVNCRTNPHAFVSLNSEIFYLDELKDVTAKQPITPGHVLTWQPQQSAWVPKAPTGGALYLNDLKDVTVPSPSDGDVVVYNDSLGVWENQNQVRSSFIHTQAAAAVEWIVSHSQASELVFAQIFDTADQVIFPDVIDVSDPNIAYFYFTEAVAGKAFILATGALATVDDHGGLTGLADDDHTQYLLHDGSRAMSGDLDLGNNNIQNIGIVEGDLHVGGDVTAEAFYLTPGSGGEISKSGNDLRIKSRNGQVVIDDSLLVTEKVVAEGFYLSDGGDVRVSVSDGSNEFLTINDLNFNSVEFYLSSDLSGAPVVNSLRVERLGTVTDGANIYSSVSKLSFSDLNFYLSRGSSDEPVVNLTGPGLLETRVAQPTTSGTVFDFLNIPSFVKRITVMLDQVSLSGTDNILVQIGDSGGFETTGYSSSSVTISGTSAVASTAGFILQLEIAAQDINGIMTLTLINTNTWVESHAFERDTLSGSYGGGRKVLSSTLDRVRVTVTGSDTFDAGQVNILYE